MLSMMNLCRYISRGFAILVEYQRHCAARHPRHVLCEPHAVRQFDIDGRQPDMPVLIDKLLAVDLPLSAFHDSTLRPPGMALAILDPSSGSRRNVAESSRDTGRRIAGHAVAGSYAGAAMDDDDMIRANLRASATGRYGGARPRSIRSVVGGFA